jgi:ADP-heptose:LPS heptosyltransferase
LLGDLSQAPFVVIFPGASIPERRWGAENFQAVAEALESDGVPSIVVGGL